MPEETGRLWRERERERIRKVCGRCDRRPCGLFQYNMRRFVSYVFAHCLVCAHDSVLMQDLQLHQHPLQPLASSAAQRTTSLHVHRFQFTVLSVPHPSPFIDSASKQFKSYKLRCTSAILLTLTNTHTPAAPAALLLALATALFPSETVCVHGYASYF